MLLSLVHFACAIWSRHWSGQVVAISNGKSSCWSFHISSRCSRGAPAVRPSAGGTGCLRGTEIVTPRLSSVVG